MMRYRLFVTDGAAETGTIYEFTGPALRYDAEMRAIRALERSGDTSSRVLRLTGQMAARAMRTGSRTGTADDFEKRYPS